MKRLSILLMVFGLLCVVAAPLPAQVIVDQASTAAEGQARGMSDVIRSAGDYNLSTSQAAINATEARRNQIQNYKESTDAYFQTRAANKAYREKERSKRATEEEWVRWAKEAAPKPLSPGDFDPVAGKIKWPVLLKADEFTKYRSELDELFGKRAATGAMSVEDRIQSDRATNALLAALKAQIREVPPDEYIMSKEFVKSLAYEARRPT
jgi:hypothetical protein